MVVLLTTNILNKRSIKCTGMFLLCDGHIHGRFVKLMLILIFMVDGYVRLGLTKQVSVQTRVGLIFKLAMVLKESKEGQFDFVKLTWTTIECSRCEWYDSV